MRRKIVITLALTLILSAQTVTAFADELELTEVTEEQAGNTLSEMSDDETEGKVVTELTEEYTYDPSGKEDEPVIADIGEITAIEKPEIARFELEFKPALDRLLVNFPKTLTVHCGDDTYEIEVKWICDGDYSKSLGEYLFIPELSDYTLAEDIEVPSITAIFEKEDYDGPTGLIPDPEAGFDYDKFDHTSADLSADTCTPDGDAPDDLPAYYNLYEQRKLPAIRDQGATGTCWAHATIAAMEADLIHDGKATTDIDLSEMHLAYYAKSGATNKNYLMGGGRPQDAAATLAALIGAVSEEDVPLSPDPYSYNPTQPVDPAQDVAQLRNSYEIYYNDANRNTIKKAVMEHGGVAIGYAQLREYYNATYNSYYEPGMAVPDHSVLIVGWDDNFSKEKFTVQPKENGAWLIRNSWGDNGYSNRGYFWMSYCQNGDVGVAIDADMTNYHYCYNSTITVPAGKAIKGVGLYVNGVLFNNTANITVTIKNKETGEKTTAKKSVTTEGIYTLEFNKPLEVYEDTEIEPSISYDYSGYEDEINHVSINCSCFYADDSNAPYTKVTDVVLNKTDISINENETASLTAELLPANATIKKVTWSSTNEEIATVSQDGTVTGLSEGTVDIIAKAYGGVTSKCKVKVMRPKKYTTVRFLDAFGDVIETRTVEQGSPVMPPVPTHKGYKFIGWDWGEPPFYFYQDNIDVTALWEQIEFTVKFYDGFGNLIKTEVVKKGEFATYPSDPSFKDYSFIGWDTALSNIYSDTEVFALWEYVGPSEPVNPDTPTPVTPVPQKTNIKNAKITLDKSSFTYNGKVQQGHIKKVILGNKTLKAGVDYTENWPADAAMSKNAGTYSFKVMGIGEYTGEVSVSYTIKKAANKLKISSKKSSYNIPFSKLKKKNRILKASTIYKVGKKGQGTVSYTLSSAKKNGKKFSKYFTVDKKTGKVTIKKGLKKGSYKVTVKVKAKGDKNYKAGSKNVVFTVTVK